MNVDESVFTIGELIVECKYPNVLAKLIASYLTPNETHEMVMEQLKSIRDLYIEVDGIHPSATDLLLAIMSFANEKN